MKNAPNLELSRLARQWGATAVPFGELSAQAWLETAAGQRAFTLLQPTASLPSVLLLGLNLAQPPAFALVLIGDQYLMGTLRWRQHRSLCSRIACHWSLSPWTATQVTQYLQQSLAAVGITPPAIEPAALHWLTSASGGWARSLCLLARTAWIQAASAGAQNIEPVHLQAALQQVPAAAGLALPPATAPS